MNRLNILKGKEERDDVRTGIKLGRNNMKNSCKKFDITNEDKLYGLMLSAYSEARKLLQEERQKNVVVGADDEFPKLENVLMKIFSKYDFLDGDHYQAFLKFVQDASQKDKNEIPFDYDLKITNQAFKAINYKPTDKNLYIIAKNNQLKWEGYCVDKYGFDRVEININLYDDIIQNQLNKTHFTQDGESIDFEKNNSHLIEDIDSALKMSMNYDLTMSLGLLEILLPKIRQQQIIKIRQQQIIEKFKEKCDGYNSHLEGRLNEYAGKLPVKNNLVNTQGKREAAQVVQLIAKYEKGENKICSYAYLRAQYPALIQTYEKINKIHELKLELEAYPEKEFNNVVKTFQEKYDESKSAFNESTWKDSPSVRRSLKSSALFSSGHLSTHDFKKGIQKYLELANNLNQENNEEVNANCKNS